MKKYLKNNFYKINNNGFTLLELMIVIAIIIILAASSIIIFNPGEKQKEQRDALRVSSLSQIASGLELYYAEKKRYPSSLTELVNFNYRLSLKDPSEMDSCSYKLFTSSNGSYYEVYAIKESINFKIPSGQDFIEEISTSQMNSSISFSGCTPFENSSSKQIFRIKSGYKVSSIVTP